LPKLAARAYDVVAWRLYWTHSELKFPDVLSVEEAEFLATPFRAMTRAEELDHRHAYMCQGTHQDDKESMSSTSTPRGTIIRSKLMQAEFQHPRGRPAPRPSLPSHYKRR
jgi:hypothetical protein